MTVQQIAANQLKKKIFHEGRLKPTLQSIFRQMTKDLKVRYIATQTLLDPSIYEPEFKAAIMHRSRLVANDFKRSYRETKGIEENIDFDIAEYLAFFVEQQLNFISQTTETQQREMLASVIRDLRSENIMPTNEIVAQRLSEKFLRAGLVRSEIISNEVVSDVAEKAKDIEVENLIIAGVISADAAEKTWVTNIDGRERETHHIAHLQRRPISQPFEVGGSLLMYPKDTSLGADMKEIFGCRCFSIYS